MIREQQEKKIVFARPFQSFNIPTSVISPQNSARLRAMTLDEPRITLLRPHRVREHRHSLSHWTLPRKDSSIVLNIPGPVTQVARAAGRVRVSLEAVQGLGACGAAVRSVEPGRIVIGAFFEVEEAEAGGAAGGVGYCVVEDGVCWLTARWRKGMSC